MFFLFTAFTAFTAFHRSKVCTCETRNHLEPVRNLSRKSQQWAELGPQQHHLVHDSRELHPPFGLSRGDVLGAPGLHPGIQIIDSAAILQLCNAQTGHWRYWCYVCTLPHCPSIPICHILPFQCKNAKPCVATYSTRPFGPRSWAQSQMLKTCQPNLHLLRSFCYKVCKNELLNVFLNSAESSQASIWKNIHLEKKNIKNLCF